MPLGMKELEWCGYRRWKFFNDMFIRFDRIHKRDGHTHRQTDTAWRHRPRLHRAAKKIDKSIV